MNDELFHRTLDTLHTYSEIYYNIADMRFNKSDRENEAINKLSEIITDTINYLHTNAKGQV